MGEYYRFHWDNEAPVKGFDLADIGELPDIDESWEVGERFETKIPTPVRCVLDPSKGTEMPAVFFFSQIPLYSDRLLAALAGAGVDNLETYTAEVVDPRTGTVRKDYKATNIVGKLECVDLKASEYDPSSEFPMIEFERIVLNEKKVRRANMFRLAENPMFIIVSEKVKSALEGSDWPGLRVISLDDFEAY